MKWTLTIDKPTKPIGAEVRDIVDLAREGYLEGEIMGYDGSRIFWKVTEQLEES